jgi:hypothetical protein
MDTASEIAQEAEEYDEGDIVMDDLVGQLRQDVEHAVRFMHEYFNDLEEAQEYYNGKSKVAVDGNGSRYVATKVRDTIRGIRPSLLRIFLSSAAPVEYLPSGEIPPPITKQQSTYAYQQFLNNNGYMVIYEAFQTAMLHKVGVVQCWWQERNTTRTTEYTNLTPTDLEGLQRLPHAELLALEEIGSMPMLGPSGAQQSVPLHKATVQYSHKGGHICMECVPWQEFIHSDDWSNTREGRVIGRQMSLTISEALEYYPDLTMDDLEGLTDEDPEQNENAGEAAERRGYFKDRRLEHESPADISMKHVLITEVYYKADLDGVGIAQCYKWILGGIGRELLTYERAEDGHNFACFQIDPEPNTLRGKSIFDITKDEQDGLTSLTRSILNNAHKSNNPRLAVHETMVNMTDVLSNDVGAPIRVRAPGLIQGIEVPFTAGQTIPLLEYWNRDVEAKTGVTRASLGLDPDALQSTDKDAVRNTIAAAAGQVEVYARNLAETGMIPLFRMILRLCLRHQHPQQVMWTTGSTYTPVNLSTFDPTLNMRVNVGLGSGSDEQKLATLLGLEQRQEKILQAFGPGQPVVQPHHVTNLISDMADLGGVKDVSRYITVLDEQASQQLQQALQQQQQAAEQKPDPQIEAIREAEQIRAQAKMQVEAAKHERELAKEHVGAEIKIAEAARVDDLERDKMLQELYMFANKLLAEHNERMDVAEVQRKQEAT